MHQLHDLIIFLIFSVACLSHNLYMPNRKAIIFEGILEVCTLVSIFFTESK